jgi:hypothetical protein
MGDSTEDSSIAIRHPTAKCRANEGWDIEVRKVDMDDVDNQQPGFPPSSTAFWNPWEDFVGVT